VDGVREGPGTVKWSNGDVYTGDFKGGLRHGKGVFISEKGAHKYEGSWKNSLKHGQGTEIWPNADKVGRRWGMCL
jgi:hypothetical protein